jgi:hypothetical protein
MMAASSQPTQTSNEKIGNVLDKLVLAVNCPQHIKHQISEAGAGTSLLADTPENQPEVTLK